MARRFVMEFERPLVELEEKLAELQAMNLAENPDLGAEVETLAAEVARLHEETYTDLDPWARVQVSRHPDQIGRASWWGSV